LRPAGNGERPAGKADPRALNPGEPAFTGLVGVVVVWSMPPAGV
jgi:hypothetical protein